MYNKSTISNFNIMQSPNPKFNFKTAVKKIDERKLNGQRVA